MIHPIPITKAVRDLQIGDVILLGTKWSRPIEYITYAFKTSGHTLYFAPAIYETFPASKEFIVGFEDPS